MTDLFLKNHDDELHKEAHVVANMQTVPEGQEEESQRLREHPVAQKFESLVNIPEQIHIKLVNKNDQLKTRQIFPYCRQSHLKVYKSVLNPILTRQPNCSCWY